METVDPAKTVKTKKNSDHSAEYRKSSHESTKPEDPRKRAPIVAETRSMLVAPEDYRSYGTLLWKLRRVSAVLLIDCFDDKI